MIRRVSLGFLVAWSLWAGAARADSAPARVEISLHEAKTRYLAGEPIVVDLRIIASGDPLAIDQATDEARMALDQIEIVPSKGVYPWKADSERFSPRWGDTFLNYPPTSLFKTSITLNRRFRFDAEGDYTIHVVTSRVRPALASNDVTFTIARPSVEEEQRRATALGEALRNAVDERTAGRLANQIDWLGDDAATEVKLGLLVGPRKSDCYFRHGRIGLWIARDRQRVVERLEQAIVDPDEDIPMGSDLVGTLVSLKVALQSPDATDANVPMAPMRGNIRQPGPLDKETAEVGAGYIHAIAATLPLRVGKSRIDAAQRVMWSKDRSRPLMDDADFVAAREALIDHFEDVNEYNIDTNLNSFGALLEDPRLIPQLHRMLERPELQNGLFSTTRGLVIKLLAKLEPAAAPSEVAREACSDHPATLDTIRDLPIDSVALADACLRAKLAAQIAPDASRRQAIELNGATLPYIARFASPALVPDVEGVYGSLSAGPDRRGAAAALAYLMRWNPARDRPLLDTAIEDRKDISLLFNMARVAPPKSDALRMFLRERIALPPARDTTSYVSALGQIGDAEDDGFFRERLAALRLQDGASPETARTENAIEQALRCNGWRREGKRC